MSAATKTSRTQIWMDSLGEWSWPGRAAEAAQALPLPPSWVPALPPRLEPLTSDAHAGTAALPSSRGAGSEQRTSRRLVALATLISGLIAACIALLVLHGPGGFERLIGKRDALPATHAASVAAMAPVTAPLPRLVNESRDGAGSSIDSASFSSAALGREGSFHVYLPPGYAETDARYPVLYLLHGNEQRATAFLELGLQGELDRLIAAHEVPPMIAVMIQGGKGANNWRDRGGRGYEAYVVEVQQLVDRMLPTQADRASRAIAGDSMGGYGAMNVALGNPRRFSIVESWLGFFNGLGNELRAARPVIAADGLHAYLYGGASDPIADPAENAPFAAQLRAAGASAHSAIYVGGHTMETLRTHLHHMLLYVGRSLEQNARKAVATRRVAATSRSATPRSTTKSTASRSGEPR